MSGAGITTDEINSWPVAELREWLASINEDPAPAESAYWWWNIRHSAQSRAYDQQRDTAERREWALAMIATSLCAERFGRVRTLDPAVDRFMMRAFVINQLGPIADGGPWDPAALAHDVLGRLTLQPEEARALAANWRSQPIETIRLLRRHKNMLGPLRQVIDRTNVAPTDLVAEWLAIQPTLP